MKYKFLPTLLIALITLGVINAQQTDQPLITIAQPQKGMKWIRFNESFNAPPSTLFEHYKTAFSLSPDDKMVLLRTEKTNLEHYHYQQFYKGVKVENAIYAIHAKKDKLQTGNGSLVSGLNQSAQPELDKKQAIEKALAACPSEKYAWENTVIEAGFKESNNGKSLYPDPELVLFDPFNRADGKGYRLTYKIDVYSINPFFRNWVYVDAQNGEVVYKSNRILHADENGKAKTRFYGEQDIKTTKKASNLYVLRETERGNGINTINMNHSFDVFGNNTDFTDEDNYWDNVNADQDEIAGDAHWTAEKTYDFFLNHLGRNSIDGKGFALNNYVHWGTGIANAGWTGTEMIYGDGDGFQTGPFIQLEVTGHEIMHGITQYTAGLIYANESGALNESYSDIFGMAVDYYYTPLVFNWELAELTDLANQTNGLRNMKDPKKHNQPNTYKGEFWDPAEEVHTNSGIGNYWFYLLVEGGTGTNDNGYTYHVDSIGWAKAINIAYRTLVEYLTPDATYDDAKTASLELTRELYGPCSPEYIAVSTAWAAVGMDVDIAVDDDIRMKSTSQIATACGLTTETISCKVDYIGCTKDIPAGSVINFNYQVDNSTPVSEPYTLVKDFKAGDSIEYTFLQPADVSAIGWHDVKIWINHQNDPIAINDTIRIGFRNNLSQNIDFGGTVITYPRSAKVCTSTGQTPVSISYSFFGCDSIPAGNIIDLSYQVDLQNTVTESFTLPTTMYPGETRYYTFIELADLTQDKNFVLKAETKFSKDTFFTNNVAVPVVLSKYDRKYTANRTITFENIGSNGFTDSIYLEKGADVIVAELDFNAAASGNRGYMFSGGTAVDFNTGKSLIPLPENESEIFDLNPSFGNKLCFCVDAASWEKPILSFDLAQNRSFVWDWLPIDFDKKALFSAMRVTVDGFQQSPVYTAQTSFGFPLFFERKTVPLYDYQGKQFEVCFDIRALSFAFEFEGFCDYTALDNIFIGDETKISTHDEKQVAGGINLYPNPAGNTVNVTWQNDDARFDHIAIYDILGKIRYENKIATGSKQKTLDLGHMQPGVYFVRLKSVGNGLASEVKKLILN